MKFNQGQELLENQHFMEDLSCLPTLKVSDIPSKQVQHDVGVKFSRGLSPNFSSIRPEISFHYARFLIGRKNNAVDYDLSTANQWAHLFQQRHPDQ